MSENEFSPKQARVLIGKIDHCKINGMSDDFIENLVSEEVERIFNFSSKNNISTLDVVEFIGRCNLFKENGKWMDDNELLADSDEELLEYITELNSRK